MDHPKIVWSASSASCPKDKTILCTESDIRNETWGDKKRIMGLKETWNNSLD